MGLALGLLQLFLVAVVALMALYTARHWIFTFSRVYGKQRMSFSDVYEEHPPEITILVPMHNEAAVAEACLDAILASDYPRELLRVIAIDDHSEDETVEILYAYAQHDPRVQVVEIDGPFRGKANALNVALAQVTSDLVLVFDADYTPGRGLIRTLINAFVDPEVGAVMGRVVPRNTSRSMLTRLLSMERAGGYQVDQQARYNFDLLPQYGGTVGGFRRRLLTDMGGFDQHSLAEDTELTAKIFRYGWKIVYDNRAECYEEVPETWQSRFKQLRRWSRGHNRVFWSHIIGLLQAPHLSIAQRVDAALLLLCYSVPPILIAGWLAALTMFLMGRLPYAGGITLAFCVVLYNAFGNFAPVYQVATAEVLDGSTTRLLLLPYLFYMFPFNSWSITSGFIDAFGDVFKSRRGHWDKTARVQETSA
ncbi:MAG TPA: glycosyltransferase family 2 protein [Candidatus Aquilonibacter sp.]|nr:glycosyltransferase family 2 protein [Candidatus Aquilonibacter sp.]